MNEGERTDNVERVLRQATVWMDAYIKSFYNDDEEIQRMMLSKETHTAKVRSICRDLALHLRLSTAETALAELMGLLHDTGRFRQFTVYRTFTDAVSVDHASLGLDIIEEAGILRPLSEDERTLITFAIENHNKKAIAPTGNDHQLFFARLLRDADKLDIYRVLEPRLAPSDGHGVSPDFLEKFAAGEQVDYTMIHTFDDRKLVRLMWIYDIHFTWVLQRVVERGYIDKIIRCLPAGETIEEGVRRLRRYVAEKCATPDR
ncbi:MAG: HD domain-containing protein [Schwartzia sp. (in: firmicutes)]